MAKRCLFGKSLFVLVIQITVEHVGKSRHTLRNLKSGTQFIEECCLLATSAWLAQVYLIQDRATCPGVL